MAMRLVRASSALGTVTVRMPLAYAALTSSTFTAGQGKGPLEPPKATLVVSVLHSLAGRLTLAIARNHQGRAFSLDADILDGHAPQVDLDPIGRVGLLHVHVR